MSPTPARRVGKRPSGWVPGAGGSRHGAHPLLAEHTRRSAVAEQADARRRESLPQGWGPPLGPWQHWRALDAKAGRIAAIFLGAMLVLGAVALVVKNGGTPPQWLTTMLSVAIMAPIGLLVLVLVEATATLVIAERRTARWARQASEHVFDLTGLRRALRGRRASWFGSLTAATVARLLLTAVAAVIVTRETVPSAAQVAPPSTLVAIAVALIGVGLVWALADIPITANERTNIRAACAPGASFSPDESGA